MTLRQNIQQAVVVGSGQMGPGIAYTLASVGCRVSIFARTSESVEKGIQAFHAVVTTLVEAGCISDKDAANVRIKITGTTQLESAAASADLVIESISEDLKLKQELFARVEEMCRAETIITSNTSGLPVMELARFLKHPNRFAVTHFWNPPHLMPLVEVVRGEKTSQQTIDTLVTLLKEASKTPVVVRKDTPGQLGNRLFHALLREAIWMVQEGIASVEDVDTAIKNGLGRRFPVYGALEHQDVAGLDTVLAIQSYMCEALCNDTNPSRILKDKVVAGDLGVKSGRGFYDWSKRDIRSVIEKRDAFLIELLKSERNSFMQLFPEKIIKQMAEAGVVAGFSVEKVEHAIPIAKALAAGGLNVIELTLRTDAALDALRVICNEVPEIVAGVGTILTPDQARQVKEAGAAFGVAPGMNPAVITTCKDLGLPFAPGIENPTDLEAAIELGCRFVKFFPAEAAGGVAYLRSMSAPYNHLGMQYFPLGGIHAGNMLDYLKEPNIPTVGGSWIVKKELVENEDWGGIEARARQVRDTVDAVK